jgi:hypothetical protein
MQECGSSSIIKSFWGVKRKNLNTYSKQDIDEKPQVVTKGELEYLLKEFTKKK